MTNLRTTTTHERKLLLGGLPKPIYIEFHITWEYDSCYGADSDGNRGTGSWHPGKIYVDPDLIEHLSPDQVMEMYKDLSDYSQKTDPPTIFTSKEYHDGD